MERNMSAMALVDLFCLVSVSVFKDVLIPRTQLLRLGAVATSWAHLVALLCSIIGPRLWINASLTLTRRLRQVLQPLLGPRYTMTELSWMSQGDCGVYC